MPTTVTYRFQVAGRTAADLISLNPTPLAREIVLETDTHRRKIGDGSTAWAGLPYDKILWIDILDTPTTLADYGIALTSANVTTALTYTPTSVTGLTGVQSIAAFKTGLSLVKGDVGLGNVDNTTDASKPISTAQQSALDLKAPKNNPALTGIPVAPTATATDNSTQIATTAFVQAVIANLIAMAPGTLDTLDELAAALGDDPNFAATVTTALATKMVKANNLSDLTNIVTARTNLGLGNVDNTADAAKNVLSATKIATARNIAASGDISWSVTFDGSGAVGAAATLATVNSNTGTFGGATTSPQISVDGKGRVTSVTAVTITPAWSSITSKPTTLSGYGITDGQSLITAAALTKTDDTNVTLTLGGTPATALLAATSLTISWTGTLSVARGGTGGGAASGTLLDNISGFASTGVLARTAAGTYAFRTFTAPAAGITISNGNGVAGNPTLALADDLAALEALPGTNTIYYRSGVSAWSAVTIGGNLTFSGGTLDGKAGTVTSVAVNTANGISATNTGSAAAPAFTFTLAAITPTTVAASAAISSATEFNLGAGYMRVATADTGGGHGGGWNFYWNNASPVRNNTNTASGIGFLTSGAIAFYAGAFGSAGTTLTPVLTLDASGTLAYAGTISASVSFRLNNQSYSTVASLDAGGGWGGGWNFSWNNASPQYPATNTTSGIGYSTTGHLFLYAGVSATAGTAAPLVVDIGPSGIDVAGEVRGDTLRLDVTATASATASTHSVPISANGTIYYVRLSATP